MRAAVVLDVGKTISKLTLWSAGGELIARETRLNCPVEAHGYTALNVGGIERWLIATLTDFAALAKIGAIIPVGHGAAAVVIRNDSIAAPPIDYESPMPASERRAYDAARDAFAKTGSPALPDGLNLGAQLHYLETLVPDATAGGTILLWPQYWAWYLSGVSASEVTSLGCHSDLWQPAEQKPSDLAVNRGWAAMLPPLRRADDALGPIRGEIATLTGLPADALVHCGLHDSNAALVAARAFPEIAEREATVVSTGTWFVAMRTPAAGTAIDIAALPEDRDCLVNVDAFGRMVPSSRFMGGREIETLTRFDERRIDIKPDQPDLLAAASAVVAENSMVLPTFAPGVGPYPTAHGRWIGEPAEGAAQRAAVSLYAALVADAALDLIGSCERILVEGRFAEAEVLVRAIASLRPDSKVFVANTHSDVSFGALRLLNHSLQPLSSLRPVKPLETELSSYRAKWRELAGRQEQAA